MFLLIYFQQDATLHSLLISRKLLYMFRVASPPIIRSTQLYLQYLAYVSNRIRTDKYISHTTLKLVPTLPQ